MGKAGEMTSDQRITAALTCGDVDYAPCAPLRTNWKP